MTKQQLEERYPLNSVMLDRFGNPSVMVYVKKFYLDQVIDGAPHLPHPAFAVDGKELDGFYLSKFPNVLIHGYACSLPDQDPATRIDLDRAADACIGKGDGYHLMTAMEWGAIALLCQKNGWLPYGNNDGGKDAREPHTVAKIAYRDDERDICRTQTGTSPVEWSHNRREDGIYDLNANVWEWVGGLRLVRGELQILPHGEVSQKEDSPHWRAINGKNGSLLIPDGHGTTPNSVKLDFINERWTYVTDPVTNSLAKARHCLFAHLNAPTLCESARLWLYALGMLPIGKSLENTEVEFYANNGAAERMAFRGGRWGQGLNSGVFKSCMDDPRTYTGDAVGFRSAYYKNFA